MILIATPKDKSMCRLDSDWSQKYLQQKNNSRFPIAAQIDKVNFRAALLLIKVVNYFLVNFLAVSLYVPSRV